MSGRASSLPHLQYLTTAFDNIKSALMLIGVELEDDIYRLLLSNKAFYEISGFPRDSVGKPVADFLDTEAYDFAHMHFQKVVKTKAALEYTQWAKVPIGRHAYEVRMIPVLNAVDEVVQIIVIATDITELVRLKEEVQTLRAAAFRK